MQLSIYKCLKWPIFRETGKIESCKNPKSGFFLLGFLGYDPKGQLNSE
jgi:hypothetical protein